MEGKMEILGLGIDFSNDYTQVSYTTSLIDEDPISMSMVPGEQKYLLPTVLYRDELNQCWYIGHEALRRAEIDGGRYIDNIPKAILDDSVVEFNIGEKTIDKKVIVMAYFEELFKMIKKILKYDIIHDISVAVEIPDKRIIDCVYSVLLQLGFYREKIRVIDHAEAFIYYTTNQKKDIWVNEVVLFDFNREHFQFSKLRTIRSTNPRTISVEDTDYSDVITIDMLKDEAGKKKADKKFFQIIQDKFRKTVVSAVFLTGIGFYEDWAVDSLPELCSKRRVFKGYNLFVKGSTYSAMKRYKKIESGEYLFDCIGRTKVNVSLLIMHDGRNMSLSLSKAGTNWYEAGAQTECILDDINKLQIIFEEPMSMMKKNATIEIPDFADRPNKATRVRISLAYVDDLNCIVKVEDMGFGEFYKPTDTVIIKEINVADLF